MAEQHELSGANAPASNPVEPPVGDYPLEREWSVWLCEQLPAKRGHAEVEPDPKIVATFSSVIEFWRWMKALPTPRALPLGTNLHIFQSGVKPTWEDPANARGGRWISSMDGSHDDKALEELCMALVGETLDMPSFEITGVVLARRKAYTRISLWLRDSSKEAEVMAVGKAMQQLANMPKLNYMDHGAPYGSNRYKLR